MMMHGLALIALGGSVRILSVVGEKTRFLRPPGALNEGRFRAQCLECNRCEEICPQGVIQPVTPEENVEMAGSPRLSFSKNYCNLCMKCTEVCPTGALRPIHQSDVLIGIARVVTNRCAAWVGADCDLCSRLCPFRAIRKDTKGRPHVAAELCTGCGICESGCRLTAGLGFTKGIVVFPADS